MGVRYKTKKDKFPEMLRQIEVLNGKSIEVGCIEGKHKWLAAIHEYGCNIKVTPKMRAFLHAKGLHLRKDTTVIRIPERSFLRSGHDKEIDGVMEKAGRAVGQVLSGQMSEEQLFDLIGEMLSTKIKAYARDLSKPSNHPYTVEQKGSSNPLVDTGNMIEGIAWRVK